MIVTPFLFYIYRFAPKAESWDLGFMVVQSGGFGTVIGAVHALFTKITLCLITTMWFFTATQWWRYAILVPFSMFLFQLSGVINQHLEYIDNYDFWYSLPIIIPIVAIMIMISRKLNDQTKILDLRKYVEDKIASINSERQSHGK
ncbi:hypothetical protein ACE939_00700 [Aquimarina sp. W85]|uniref:hypothetical protein n=1 Tax=Aquimarina rhodophyticola TaxID=3342246 RepID=UPI0036726090